MRKAENFMKDEKVLNLTIEERAALLAEKRKKAQQHLVIAARYRLAARLAKEVRQSKDKCITVKRRNEIAREEFERVKTQIDMEHALFTKFLQDSTKLIKDVNGKRIAFTNTETGQFVIMPFARNVDVLGRIASRQTHNGNAELDNAKRVKDRIDYVASGGVDDEELTIDIEEKGAKKAAEGEAS